MAVGGLGLGAILRYALPGRTSHGAALLPAIGMIVASVVWAVLTWVGWPFDGGWIWWASLGLGTLSALAAGLALPPRRRESDARLLASLTKA
ncbi:MAG: hypothetical protein RI885_2191 [Actinomycetota bacterium]